MKNEVWFAVETAFVGGQHLKSIPMFDQEADQLAYGRLLPGICLAGHDEEPHNTCQTFLKGFVEIHTDWFQTKEEALGFINGQITYIAHYRAKYRPEIKSTIRTFIGWETVSVSNKYPSYLPYKGVYMDHSEDDLIKLIQKLRKQR